MAGLEAIVVIPAHDEAERIGACLGALATQSVAGDRFEIIIVLDGCTDATDSVAALAAGRLGLELTLVAGPGRGPGPARRVGMDLAAARLRRDGSSQALIATTDADSRPHPEWLRRQLAHRNAGARVIAGLIELDAAEAARLPAAVLAARERDAAARLRAIRRADPDAAHHHFAGASLAVTAETYEAVGGIEPLAALEDDGFARRLAEHRIPVLRAPDVVVVTSARTAGRVTRGLSVDLAVASWLASGRHHADAYPPARLTAAKRQTTTTVIVPAKECADTIAGVLERSVGPALDAGLVDEVVVVDAASADGTAGVAAACGARVLQQDALARAWGPAQGKGDAMWRALLATGGDVVCFLDADTRDPDPAHLLGLLGPLLTDPAIDFVKGSFDRPLDTGTGTLPNEGGRVTELMARPVLNLHHPLLAGFSQPLAGEFAARRALLEAIPFPVGYGVETATLIDALTLRGLDALAECQLGTRQNRHQPLRDLGEIAYAVLAAVERRRPAPAQAIPTAPAGRYVRPWGETSIVTVPIDERPPIREVRPGAPRPRSGSGPMTLRSPTKGPA